MKAITARAGKPHITPLMDATWHTGLLGTKTCVLSAYENFEAEVITNNKIRIKSGVGAIQGRFFCIEPGNYDEVIINNGTQGEKRLDLIAARWMVNLDEEIEKIELTVIQGAPTTGNPVAPDPVEGDLDNQASTADFPLYEIYLDGINITEVKPLFKVVKGINQTARLDEVNFFSKDQVLKNGSALFGLKTNGYTRGLVGISTKNNFIIGDPAQPDEPINFYGKVNFNHTPACMDKLWQIAEKPTNSEFPPQTIKLNDNINLRDYNIFAMIFDKDIFSALKIVSFTYGGYSTYASYSRDFEGTDGTGSAFLSSYDTKRMWTPLLSSNSIQFEKVYVGGKHLDSGNNTELIPIALYGFKGVAR